MPIDPNQLNHVRFSRQAKSYARFRPEYPHALYDFLVQLVPSRRLAWDCGTGSGQAARALARYFERVIATDTSAEQLRYSAGPPNVSFRLGEAESGHFEQASVDLVTVAQAAHWFEPWAFYEAVNAALRPSGIIAIWGYGFFRISPEIDAILGPYGREFLRSYWSTGNRIVLEGYREFPFPFINVTAPRFEMSATWDLTRLKGYLDSWSAAQAYKDHIGRDPFDTIAASLSTAWGQAEQQRLISWDLTVLVGRKRAENS
jgi:SAM-dependent methyltransferase